MASAQVTQVAIEVLTRKPGNAQNTQTAVEVLTHTFVQGNVTQVALEILVPNGSIVSSSVEPLIFTVT